MRFISALKIATMTVILPFASSPTQAAVRSGSTGVESNMVAGISIYPDKVVEPKEDWLGIAYDVPDFYPNPDDPCDLQWEIATLVCTSLWNANPNPWKADLTTFLKNCRPQHMYVECGGTMR